MSLFYFSFALSSTRPCKQKPHACLDEFRANVRFNLHFYVQHRELKGRTRDVPRLRGEKFEFPFFLLNELGSPPLTPGKAFFPCPPLPASRITPPLTRGKVHVLHLAVGISGITPAYAGKRYFFDFICILHKDHPRLRGEKSRESAYLPRA